MANNDQFKKAGDAAQQAKEKAGQLAHDNRDKIRGVLGKLASTIDDKTSRKYSDKINKAKDAALKGADKLADQAPASQASESGALGAQTPAQHPEQQTPPPGQNRPAP